MEVIYNIEFPYYTKSAPILKELLSLDSIHNEELLDIIKNKYGEQKTQNAIQWLIRKKFIRDHPGNNSAKGTEYRSSIHTVVLSISHDCNLACTYCYADRGRYGGQKGFVSFQTAKDVVDFFFKNSGEHKKLKFFFFGGEPLLNFSLIQQLVPYIRDKEEIFGKSVGIGFTTNATLLTKSVVDFCNKNNIHVHVSVDGPKSVHDRNRPFHNNVGSFDLIEKNLKYLIETRPKRVSSRATFSHGNIHLVESISAILKMGFSSVYIGPASGLHESSIKAEDLNFIKEQYNSLSRIYIEKMKSGLRFPVNPLDLKVKQCNRRRLQARSYGCGAGRGYVAVTKDGDIYPCKKCVESGSYYMGNIYDGINEEMHKYFYLNVVSKPTKDCHSCWIKNLCGGSCIMRPLEYGMPDIDRSYNLLCKISEHIHKLAMVINIKLDMMRKNGMLIKA